MALQINMEALRPCCDSPCLSADTPSHSYSRLSHWSQTSNRRSSTISMSSTCSSDSSGYVSPIAACNHTENTMTLAQMFQEQWDPAFAAYLEKINVKASDKTPRMKLIPDNQIPSAENNFSVSNYAIENVLAIGKKYGADFAEKALAELTQHIPFDEQYSFRARVLQRAQLLMKKKQQQPLCAFCRNNGETSAVFMSHILKDEQGRIRCPVLRAYCCPRCGASGDNAHTITYCPLLKREEQLKHKFSRIQTLLSLSCQNEMDSVAAMLSELSMSNAYRI